MIFYRSTPSIWKVDDGGNGEKRKKIMTFIVATNIIASQPPKCRPTGTPTACSQKWETPSEILKNHKRRTWEILKNHPGINLQTLWQYLKNTNGTLKKTVKVRKKHLRTFFSNPNSPKLCLPHLHMVEVHMLHGARKTPTKIKMKTTPIPA